MEISQNFRALGFTEMPENRQAVEAAYEAKRKGGTDTNVSAATESEKLAARLLEENFRACLRCFGDD